MKRGGKLYDPTNDGLNALPMEYREAREFAAAVFPDKDLMTYRNGRHDDQEANGVVKDLLQSPLLAAALQKPIPRWFYSGATIIARLNRKQIGDDDAKVIANILISQFKGQIVIEDFGFYAREHHATLIREERLIAGVYTLSELPEKLRERASLMP